MRDTFLTIILTLIAAGTGVGISYYLHSRSPASVVTQEAELGRSADAQVSETSSSGDFPAWTREAVAATIHSPQRGQAWLEAMAEFSNFHMKIMNVFRGCEMSGRDVGGLRTLLYSSNQPKYERIVQILKLQVTSSQFAESMADVGLKDAPPAFEGEQLAEVCTALANTSDQAVINQLSFSSQFPEAEAILMAEYE